MNLLAINMGTNRTEYLYAKLNNSNATVNHVGFSREVLSLIGYDNEVETIIKKISSQKHDQVYITLPTFLFRIGCWSHERLVGRSLDDEEIIKFIKEQIMTECDNKEYNLIINQTNIIKRYNNDFLITSGAIDEKYITVIEKIMDRNNINICSIEPQSFSLIRMIFQVTQSFVLFEKYTDWITITVCDKQKGIFMIPFDIKKHGSNVNDFLFFTDLIIEETFKTKSSVLPVFLYNFKGSEEQLFFESKERIKKIRMPDFVKYEKNIVDVATQKILYLLGSVQKGLIDNRSDFAYENRSAKNEFSVKTIISKELLQFSKKENKYKIKSFIDNSWNRLVNRN